MLIKSGLLKEYLEASKTLRKVTGLHEQWEDRSSSLKIHRKPYIFAFVTCTGLGLSLLGSSVIQLTKKSATADNSEKRESNEQLSVGLLLGFASLLIVHFSFASLKHERLIRELINGLVQFERQHCKEEDWTLQDKRKMKVTKFACQVIRYMGGLSAPLFLATCAILLPSLPMNVLLHLPFGNWLIQKLAGGESGEGLTEILRLVFAKGVIFGMSSVPWFALFNVGIIVTNRIFIVAVSLSLAVSHFKRKIEASYNAPAEFQRWIVVYRKIQLLTELFNQIHSKALISFLLMMMAGEVIPFFSLSGGHRHKPDADDINYAASSSMLDLLQSLGVNFWLRIFFVQILILSATVINFMFGFCGELHHNSSKCLGKLRHDIGALKKKQYRRQLRTLAPVKVNFGGANYIEKTTPVVYQQFTAQRIVDGLLLSKKN